MNNLDNACGNCLHYGFPCVHCSFKHKGRYGVGYSHNKHRVLYKCARKHFRNAADWQTYVQNVIRYYVLRPRDDVCISETCLRHCDMTEESKSGDDDNECIYGCLHCALIDTTCGECDKHKKELTWLSDTEKSHKDSEA